MTARLLIAFMAWIGCITPASAEASSCESSGFLHRYSVIGATDWHPDGLLALDLSADLHAADCGAPDCYGTRIHLRLSLDRSGDRCRITEAILHTEGFASSGCRQAHSEELEVGKVRVEPEKADLADPQLSEVVFRDMPSGRALVVLPTNFFYFEEVGQDDELRRRLDPGEVMEENCCWGASSAALLHYEAYEEASSGAEAVGNH